MIAIAPSPSSQTVLSSDDEDDDAYEGMSAEEIQEIKANQLSAKLKKTNNSDVQCISYEDLVCPALFQYFEDYATKTLGRPSSDNYTALKSAIDLMASRSSSSSKASSTI